MQDKTQEFISKAIKIHGTKFDYSLVNYIKLRNRIKIICSNHGIFEQTPEKHLIGRGCPFCAKTKKMNTFDFIEKANKTHIEYDGEQHFKLFELFGGEKKSLFN
jgi:hypothetical protein